MTPTYCPRCGTALDERHIEGRERKWCAECERPVFRNAVPCADVTVVDGDRALLVQRARPPDVGSWSVPGGHLEVEENPREGAARELREETGLTVEPGNLALLEATQLDVIDGKHVVSVAYAVSFDRVGGDPRAGSDAAAIEWVPVEKLSARPLRPHVERRVHAALDTLAD